METPLSTRATTRSPTPKTASQIDSGPLQLHLCEGRQRLEDRRPPLVRGASPAQVSADRRRIAGAPETGLVFDVDSQAACATRLRMFDRVAAHGLAVAGAHLDFPGFG